VIWKDTNGKDRGNARETGDFLSIDLCNMQTTQEVADEAVQKQNTTAARILRYSNCSNVFHIQYINQSIKYNKMNVTK
jgi:hypothetical protein